MHKQNDNDGLCRHVYVIYNMCDMLHKKGRRYLQECGIADEREKEKGTTLATQIARIVEVKR